jgi:hypothetical protein
MDRHDRGGATAQSVAEAHRKDVEIQSRYGGRRPLNGSTAKPLGQIANAIVPVDLTAVEAFLGRIGDSAGAPCVAPKIDAGRRAVMFTDIVGSTEMTSRLGDRAALELRRVHDARVRRGSCHWASGASRVSRKRRRSFAMNGDSKSRSKWEGAAGMIPWRFSL